MVGPVIVRLGWSQWVWGLVHRVWVTPAEPSAVVEMLAEDMAAEVVSAGFAATEKGTVVAEKRNAVVAAAAKVDVDTVAVVAEKPDAGLAVAVAAAKVEVDVLAAVAEKPEIGLAAAAAAAAKMDAVQESVVARVHTHASMVLPDGTLAFAAVPWGETASRAVATH